MTRWLYFIGRLFNPNLPLPLELEFHMTRLDRCILILAVVAVVTMLLNVNAILESMP